MNMTGVKHNDWFILCVIVVCIVLAVLLAVVVAWNSYQPL